ncbi:extracellular solute-binding protein [Candidatus Gracilibacteria bacterium]|nr:extracellular solute-binding protein [Candidatus Gracilibacteria bacterium]MCF7856846.1 extracellular solute-binding protein [Candidatus Gracilibacteria bacterium]MCF7896936.1 extracellular solute-binding protein [Candidatus Gracilibacteria bacterium]
MQAKLFKLLLVLGGIILVWILAFFILGKKDVGPTTKIEFWNVFDTTETMEPFLKDFTSRTGIRVNYRNFTDLKDYRETLLLELASGGGPDVLAVHATWIPKYRSLLLPLPVELGSAEMVSRDFLDAVAGTVIFKEEVSEKELKQGRVVKDEVFALPMYLDTLALFYNQPLFRNILSKPYPAPELTWAGVRDDAMKLSTKDLTDSEGFRLAGIALGRADNISRGVDIFYDLYHQFGGQNLSAAGREQVRDDAGKVYNPLSVSLEFLTAFSRDSRNQEYSWNSKMGLAAPEKELHAFARGKVAMMVGYSYYYDEIQKLLGQTNRFGDQVIPISAVKIAPLPQVRDPLEGNPKTAIADFFALAVAKSSAKPFASWQLILDLTARDSQSKYFTATKKSTSRRDLVEAQKADSIFGVFAEQAVYADVLPVADDELFDAAVADVLNRVSDGELKPVEGSQELADVFTSTVNK